MKKIVLTLIILVFASHLIQAQVRHLKGQRGLEVFAGISQHGQVYGTGFSQYLTSRLYLKAAGAYETGTISEVDITTYMVEVTANYTLFSINPQVFFNAVLGGSGIYEKTADLESTFDQEGFSPGIIGGLEIEIFLSTKLMVLAAGSQRYYFQSPLGSERWLATAGLKYLF